MNKNEQVMTVEEIRARINKLKKLLKEGQITENEYDKQIEYYSRLQKGGLSEREYNKILKKLFEIDLIPEKESGAKKKQEIQQVLPSDSKFTLGCTLLTLGILFFIVGGILFFIISPDISNFDNIQRYYDMLWIVYFILFMALIMCFSGIGLMIIGFRNEWRNAINLKK